MDAKNGRGGVKATGRTGAKDADVTFEATDADLYDILTGKLDAKQAYFSVSGKYQLSLWGVHDNDQFVLYRES